jgi:hypothetical protein
MKPFASLRLQSQKHTTFCLNSTGNIPLVCLEKKNGRKESKGVLRTPGFNRYMAPYANDRQEPSVDFNAMALNPKIHRHCSIRPQGLDYVPASACFIRICTQNQENLFGEIRSIDFEPLRANRRRQIA